MSRTLSVLIALDIVITGLVVRSDGVARTRTYLDRYSLRALGDTGGCKAGFLEQRLPRTLDPCNGSID